MLRGSALRALQYSLVLMLAAMTLAIGAFVCQNFLGFVLSWAGCGLFSGIGAAAAMKISMADIHADERAEMLALIYAVGYAASADFWFYGFGAGELCAALAAPLRCLHLDFVAHLDFIDI